MLFNKSVVFLVAALAAAGAQAQIGVTADLGTTGAGLHLVVPMESNLNGRFGVNYFSYDFDKRSGELDYKLDGKLQTFDVLFDWYVRPGSQFRLTGGVVYNGTEFSGVGTPVGGGAYLLNGNRYAANHVGRIESRLQFRKAAPYLGIGWGNALTPNKGWNFGADLGVLYQGTPRIELGNWGCTATAAICGALAKDIAVEEGRLAEDVEDYKFFPVLRASVSYRF